MKIADNIDMNKKGIYIITNLISNAVYIGCTRTTFHHRLKAHIWALEGNRHKNSHLQNAYNKYGEDEFEFNVLCQIEDNDKIYEQEKYYIQKYKQNGYTLYNMTDGGEGFFNLSEECRKIVGEKNRQRMLGAKLSDETKHRMSEARKGRKLSDKQKQALIEANKHKVVSDETKIKLSKRFEGENSNFAKFTNDDIINIKQMLIDDVDINIIAETFNTSYKYIKSIQYNKRWKHIIIDGWDEYVDRLPHKQRITQEVKDNIYKDYQCGLGMSDIKRKYNVSYDTIKRYIK